MDDHHEDCVHLPIASRDEGTWWSGDHQSTRARPGVRFLADGGRVLGRWWATCSWLRIDLSCARSYSCTVWLLPPIIPPSAESPANQGVHVAGRRRQAGCGGGHPPSIPASGPSGLSAPPPIAFIMSPSGPADDLTVSDVSDAAVMRQPMMAWINNRSIMLP